MGSLSLLKLILPQSEHLLFKLVSVESVSEDSALLPGRHRFQSILKPLFEPNFHLVVPAFLQDLSEAFQCLVAILVEFTVIEEFIQ